MIADAPVLEIEENGIKLSDEDKEKLESERGYVDVVGVGEGTSRDAFRATHKPTGRSRILKRMRGIDGMLSATTYTNARRRDLVRDEIKRASTVSLPGFADFQDVFELGGTTWVAETDTGGTSLDAILRAGGSITDKKVKQRLFGQLIDHEFKLQMEHGCLHGDIKPENIIVDGKGNPTYTDLQYLRRIDSGGRDLSIVTTKGATRYTSRGKLNAFLSGKQYSDGPKEDIVSLGATFYRTLMSEEAFPYEIDLDETGVDRNARVVDLGDGDEARLVLKVNGKSVESISAEDRSRQIALLKKNMKRAKIPKRDITLVEKCLIEGEKGFADMGQVQDFFMANYADTPLTRFRERVANQAHYVTAGAAIAATLAVVTPISVYAIRRPPAPKFADVMSPEKLEEFEMTDVRKEYGSYSLHSLAKTMDFAEEKLSVLERSNGRLNLESLAGTAEKHGIDARFFASWLRSCYINQGSGLEGYDIGRGGRVPLTFVPHDFVLMTTTVSHAPVNPEVMFDRQKVEFGINYLKLCLGEDFDGNGEVEVLDPFLKYFSTTEDVNTAKMKGNGVKLDYFTEGSDSYSGQNNRGYGVFLPPHQHRLINTALGLYWITDPDTLEIDWSRAPEVRQLRGGRYYAETSKLPGEERTWKDLIFRDKDSD